MPDNALNASQAMPDRRMALFFDIDGTLAPLAATPDAAFIPDEMLQLLHALSQQQDGALALISGRNLADIDHLCEEKYTAAGQHGLELRLPDGMIERNEAHLPLMTEVAAKVREMAKNYPGLLVETKGLSVALHYRQVPDLEMIAHDEMLQLHNLYSGQLYFQQGKMVVELRAAGGGKDAAIRRFMQLAPFQHRLPVFVGDDATDEAGFATVNDMQGISIKIGAGATQARWQFPAIEHLTAWLHQLAERNASPAMRASA